MTKVSVLTGASSIMLLCEIRRPGNHYATIRIFTFHRLLKMFFQAIQFHWWQEFSIGDLVEAIAVTTDTDKFFHVRVPWGNVFVAYRPVDAVTIFGIRFKVEFAPPLRHACPQ